MTQVRRRWIIGASGLAAVLCLAYWWVTMAPSWDPNISEADYHAWDERTGLLPLLAFLVGVAIPAAWLVAWLFNWLFPRRSYQEKAAGPGVGSGPAA